MASLTQAKPAQAPPALARRVGRLEGAAVLAAVIWVAEVTTAIGGQPSGVLSAAVLGLVPGLCAWRLLPKELAPLARVAAIPIVGMAISSTLLISVAALGVALTDVTLRALPGMMVLLALVVPPTRTHPPRTALRQAALSYAPVALGLGAVVTLGIFLQGQVLGRYPVPGQDWGHYLLYAQEIARHHSLLIDNPYWMLGVPFREDPGTPALYGSYLIMTGKSATTLGHGIWVFAALGPVSLFVLATGLADRVAGLVAAALYAVIPINQTILGWHGLANVYALQFVPIALLAAAMLLRGGRDWRWSALLALMMVALLAGHRLTLGFTLAAVGLMALTALALGYRPKLRSIAVAAGASAVAGAGVMADLIVRGEGSGGLQGYRTYLHTKVDWELTARDLTAPVWTVGVVALLAILGRRVLRRDVSATVLVGLTGATLLLAYAWLLGIPSVYYRAAYFLPLLIAVAVGLATSGVWLLVPRWGRIVPVLLAVVLAATALRAYDRAAITRDFYAWSNPSALRGLDLLSRRLAPDDVIVADRCWSFLSAWLLQRPALAAIDDADIQPAAELEGAAVARWLLNGPDAATATASVMGARYALVNPTCTDSVEGRPIAPPRRGTPVFASERLVILRLTDPGDRPPRLTAPALAALLKGRPLRRLRPPSQLRG